jgi:hypothetical protein
VFEWCALVVAFGSNLIKLRALVTALVAFGLNLIELRALVTALVAFGLNLINLCALVTACLNLIKLSRAYGNRNTVVAMVDSPVMIVEFQESVGVASVYIHVDFRRLGLV